jgi:hypothetical protein
MPLAAHGEGARRMAPKRSDSGRDGHDQEVIIWPRQTFGFAGSYRSEGAAPRRLFPRDLTVTSFFAPRGMHRLRVECPAEMEE